MILGMKRVTVVITEGDPVINSFELIHQIYRRCKPCTGLATGWAGMTG